MAGYQRQQRGVKQGLDYRALGRLDLVESVVAPEFGEEQLHLPSGLVGSGHFWCAELRRWDVGQVEMVRACFLVQNADEPKCASSTLYPSSVAPSVELDFDFNVEALPP